VYWHASDDRAPGAPRISLARRMFIHWGPDNARHDAHLDVYFRHPHSHGWGGYLRLDGPGAETPLDAAIFLGPAFAFAGTSVGRRLCRWLRVPDGSSRQISIELRRPEGGWKRLTHWTLCWSLWTDPEHQVRPTKWQRDHEHLSRWYVARRGYIHPIGDVLDQILGKTVCTTAKDDPIDAVAHFADGPVPLRVTLETRTWRRPRSPRTTTMISAWVDVTPTSEGGPGLVPTGKYSYGKEDGLCGTSVRELTPCEAADSDRWVPIAIASFTESVLHDRARYGWRPFTAEET
jgi:hypothetical protein